MGVTILEYVKAELEKSGLFDTMVEEVLPRIINAPILDNMKHRWNDKTSDYPEGLLRVTWMLICTVVLEYIDEKCPMAWFRPMFDLKDPIHKMTKEELIAGTPK
jgi:hypothetical protein